ncbi:PLDc N-terminal domain-containing protein [Parapedobacter tibetensis]|uniref:PLDc N-terminal domain-containing protein n=1 Tax=Parapedobacter tibetensis TaxID=2972951 RepID=UPI00356B64F1
MIPLFSNIGLQEIVLLLFFILPTLVVYFYCLFHAAINRNIPGWHRLLWFFVILSLPLLGSIAYWMIGRKATKVVA